ncbi:MAG: restriction endonuclease subunit S [Kiritimatiellae bacterium]|nr:restriction endonuclease subunit S [Kiritimatiellia bacterium]
MSRLSRAAAGGELRVDDGCVGAALAGPRRWLGSAVEWKKLGEVAKICRGVRVVKKELTDDGKYAVYQNSLKPLGYYGEANVKGGTAFVIGAGAAGEVGYSEQDFWAADDCYYIDGGERLIGRYVYYCLTSRQDWLLGKVRKASIPRLSRDFIAALEIPLPPLEIQREVVEILDNFANLTAELTAELAKRKKQYEHYRDMLLNFTGGGRYDKFGVESGGFRVEWKRLGEIGRVAMCKRILKQQTMSEGEIPFYKIGTFGKEPDAFISRALFDEYRSAYSYPNKGDILISAAGTIGRAIIFDGKPAYYQDSNIVWLAHDESTVLNKYLYFFYQTNPWKVAVGGTIPRLYNRNIEEVSIPLPPLAEQERIVAILDRFDSLCNSLTEGLPAEIALRKKQYEYYRDKLLSFKEAS